MSLINEALKKAQAQQSGTSRSPGYGSGDPSGGGNRPPHRPNLWLVFGVFLVVAFGLGGAATLVIWGLFTKSQPEQTASEPASASSAIDELEKEDIPEGGLDPIDFPSLDAEEAVLAHQKRESSNSTQTSNGESNPASPSPDSDSQASETVSGQNNTPEPQVADTTDEEQENDAVDIPPPEKPAPDNSPKPDKEIQEYLTALEIRGIMSGGQKILLYDPETGKSSTYDSGSTISRTPEIKIRRISGTAIYFVDNAGFTYIKRF